MAKEGVNLESLALTINTSSTICYVISHQRLEHFLQPLISVLFKNGLISDIYDNVQWFRNHSNDVLRKLTALILTGFDLSRTQIILNRNF